MVFTTDTENQILREPQVHRSNHDGPESDVVSSTKPSGER